MLEETCKLKCETSLLRLQVSYMNISSSDDVVVRFRQKTHNGLLHLISAPLGSGTMEFFRGKL